jgi:hypothetical protein
MLDMMYRHRMLGRRQVVRQLVLVQPFRGSNPFAPVNSVGLSKGSVRTLGIVYALK